MRFLLTESMLLLQGSEESNLELLGCWLSISKSNSPKTFLFNTIRTNQGPLSNKPATSAELSGGKGPRVPAQHSRLRGAVVQVTAQGERKIMRCRTLTLDLVKC